MPRFVKGQAAASHLTRIKSKLSISIIWAAIINKRIHSKINLILKMNLRIFKFLDNPKPLDWVLSALRLPMVVVENPLISFKALKKERRRSRDLVIPQGLLNNNNKIQVLTK